ncbi:MAG: polysaccharide export protein [Epsilonproteobacteria bacterium]|nr:polysaccharide export protein [Campylobacterota bacterium]
MKKIVLFLFFINILWSVEVTLDNRGNDSKALLERTEKIYFGERLFKGQFKENKQLTHNLNYLINVGDVVSVKLWGAYEYASELTVDTKGNIFIPKVGIVRLLGVKAQGLRKRVRDKVKQVFNNNVSVYAELNTYQPISVFLTGGVVQPGLYEGISSDSILQFIDKAGGIKHSEGSYRKIMVLRNNISIKTFDLYEFLLNGKLETFQFQNGDIIKVSSLENIIEIEGEVNRPYIFELVAQSVMVDEIIQYVLPKPNVTHFMVTRWQNGREKVEKYTMQDRYRVMVKSGERIHFVSDYLKDNIMVNIEGEHGNLHTVTVQKGDSLKKILSQLILTPLSDATAIQLYRNSIAIKQKKLIDTNLRDLEARVLTTGSSTTEEAKIRKEESNLVLDFIRRASQVKPKGQVIINASTDLSQVILEENDTIYIPKKSQIVVIEGEVSLPNAQTYVNNYDVDDYIKSCGGYSPRANREKVLLVKKNGRVLTYDASNWWRQTSLAVEPGDSILVLGRVDSKSIQITSSVTQILYQIAVGAAVVLKAF